jgi:hypothetical protein
MVVQEVAVEEDQSVFFVFFLFFLPFFSSDQYPFSRRTLSRLLPRLHSLPSVAWLEVWSSLTPCVSV